MPKKVFGPLNPLRKWMGIPTKMRMIYKFVKKHQPELLPFSPPLPTRVTVSGATVYANCPTVSQPYVTPMMYKYFVTPSTQATANAQACTGGQVPTGNVEEAYPDGFVSTLPYSGTMIIGPGIWVQDGWHRMQYDEVWSRSSPGMITRVLHSKKRTWVRPPLPYYTADPESAPILQPAPFPLPLPFRYVPLRPDRGLQPSAEDQGIVSGSAPPRPGYADPDAGPAIGTDGGGFTPAPPHVFMPPGRGERERKQKLGAGADALKKIMDRVGGPATEAADAIKAIYDALGKKCKGANTPQAQLQCIYTNFSTLDAGQAVANLIANEAQDRAIGKIGSAVKSVGGKRPGGLKPIGWGTGPAI